MPDSSRDAEAGRRAPADRRPKLTRRDAWHLVWSTYRASFPYLLLFIVGMLVATWLVTTVLFR
jgi:hypothetical protein